MKEEKKKSFEGKTVHEVLEPSKVAVTVMAELERRRMDTMMRKEAEEWAKNKNK